MLAIAITKFISDESPKESTSKKFKSNVSMAKAASKIQMPIWMLVKPTKEKFS